MALRLGKLPLGLLGEVLALPGAEDPAVRLGPAIGEDAAVVEVGEEYLVLSTDPITFAQEDVGWYAVQVNANDVVTRGAKPRWFQASILFPRGATPEEVRRVARQIDEACRLLGIAITGGHTEVTDVIDRVVVVGAMQGVVSKDRLITTAGAQEGDDLLLTKGAGIEGTALLARERGEELGEALGEEAVARAAKFLWDPGLSVVREASLAADFDAHAMHDPTEGGVAMGLLEVSMACEHVLEILPSAIPIPPETASISAHFGLNPFGLLASGALIVAVAPERTAALLTAASDAGIPAAQIGRVGASGVGLEVRDESPYPFEPTERDEIARVHGA